MWNRAFRPFAMMLSILLLASVSVQASPVNVGEVVSVLGGLQNGARIDRLRLRAVTQDPGAPASPASVTNSLTASSSAVDVIDVNGSPAAQPSLIAGTDVVPQNQGQVNVEVFAQDNVDGTICDCGEIPSAGGGFSKWWLLALVPLVCVTGICHHEKECVTCPTPTPTPPPIPEPATLLLLGSGLAVLGAGARRRYAKARSKSEAATTEEV